MSGISTHVLNTAAGRPSAGISVRLFYCDLEVGSGITDASGRCSELLAKDAKFETGVYRIVFDVASIFPEGLYPEVSVTFRVSDTSAHYHLPLLLSPFGYSTYRGT
jgi:5-hydroxyisourate hydrolase